MSPPSTSSLLPTLSRLIARFIVPIVLVIFGTPFVVLVFYSVPALDDFCKSTLSFNSVPQRDVFSVTWLYYTEWTPRWLTTALQSMAMSRLDMAAEYGWLLLAVIVTNLASLWYFFRTFFRLNGTTSFLVSGVFYAAYVASLSDPGQQLFWLTGAMEYNLSFSTLLVLVSLLFRPRSAAWYYLAVGLLSFAIPAQHEIAGTFLCVLLVAITIATRIKRVPAGHIHLSLGVAALSQVIVMLSPGPALRAAQEHKHLWDFAHLPQWIGNSFYYGLNSFAVPAILLAACGILVLVQPGNEAQGAAPPLPKWLGPASLCAMLFLLCESALVELATGTWLPYRAFAWFQFMFWLLFVCVVLAGIPEIHLIRFSPLTKIGVFSLFAVILLGSTNFREAVEDSRGPAQSWWRMNASRFKQHGRQLVFDTPVQYPHLAVHQLLGTDATCWVNMCFANYERAVSVVVKDSTEECPR
jgi:hypothetical protein